MWPCGNEQADGNTFLSPIVAARAHSCYPQCDIPYPSYKLWQLPPQTELITSCWHSVIETQSGGQHNCLFSVVSPSSYRIGYKRARWTDLTALHTECFDQEGHAVVAVQLRVFSNSVADEGKMSTACVTCLTSEAKTTLTQRKMLRGSQNQLQNYRLFRNYTMTQ